MAGKLNNVAKLGGEWNRWSGYTPFSAPEKMEMILLRLRSSGTEGRGFELWLAASAWSFPPPLKIVLLILTGGAGGLSSRSPLSHMVQDERKRTGKKGRVGTFAGGDKEKEELELEEQREAQRRDERRTRNTHKHNTHKHNAKHFLHSCRFILARKQ